MVGVASNALTCSGTVARVVWRWDIARKSTSILMPEASKNSLTLRYKECSKQASKHVPHASPYCREAYQ